MAPKPVHLAFRANCAVSFPPRLQSNQQPPFHIPMKRTATSRENSRLLTIVTAVVVIGVLYFGRVVFMPLALAILFAVLLTPVVSFLERLKIPRVLAILLVVVLLFGFAGFMVWETSQQFGNLADQLPTYKQTLEDKITFIKGSGNRSFNKASNAVSELTKEISAPAPGSQPADGSKKAGNGPGSSTARPLPVQVVPPANPLESVENLLGPLATVLIILVFTIFILYGREDLRNRLIRLASRGRLNVMTQAMDEATERINRYLFLQLLVNVCYGLIIATSLHFIGIPNAALWGVTAAVLRFLPYVGPPLAALMPILFSLAVFPGWHHTVLTAGVFFVLELVVSNFVEPPLYGSHIGLSPLAILVAAAFWTLIWGFPGLVLSTPLTVCLMVVGRYVPDLGFLNILLGDEPVLSPSAQYYQRLLASDQTEARRVLEQCLKGNNFEEVCSSVIIPALGLAERDRHQNELDEDSQTFIYQSTREIVEEIEIPSPDETATPDSPATPETRHVANNSLVLCIPARDDADEVVASLLARILVFRGRNAQTIPLGSTAETLAQVREAHPDLVCISALPPFAINSTRSLYANLRAQFPALNIAVCLWQFDGDLQKGRTALRLVQGHELFTTLPQVLQFIDSLDLVPTP
jgi:predicted PurR-regulated permease PerM